MRICRRLDEWKQVNKIILPHDFASLPKDPKAF